MGLALSGGGIRSATLSLGILQSLARNDLLKRFDYLSTVSGGGYMGCYFGSLFLPQALRQGRGEPPAGEFTTRCEKAYDALKESAVPTVPSPDCAGVRSTLVEGSSKPMEDGSKKVSSKKVSSKEEEEKDDKTGWTAAKSFEWLRNNGRYLAPRGTGDLIYVAAMQVRNWAAIQYVVGVAIVFFLLAFATARAWMIAKCPWWQEIELMFLPKPGATIYWSPGWVLVGGFGLLFVVPPALAYWVAHSRVDRNDKLSWIPMWHEYTIIFLVLLGLTWAYGVLKVTVPTAHPFQDLPDAFWAVVGYVVITLFAIGVFFVGFLIERRGLKLSRAYLLICLCLAGLLIAFVKEPQAHTASLVVRLLVALLVVVLAGLLAIGALVAAGAIAVLRQAPQARLDLKSLRTRFTGWLRWTFQAFLGAAGLALLGTIGQTVYAYLSLEPGAGAGAFAGATSLVAAIVAGARLLFKWLGTGNKRVHPKIPLGALAGTAAVLLLLLTGGAWAVLVQSALWGGGPPPAIPGEFASEGPRAWTRASGIEVSPWGRNPRTVVLDTAGTRLVAAGKPVATARGWMSVLLAGAGFLALTTGLFINFLNMSSLHQFYAARLTRAYLGATNRDRFKANRVMAVTSPLPTDTIPLAAYYDERLAAPVHLINVTVNQTRPSEGQLVQRDRKGTSMVIGPKYTIVNSAIFERSDRNGTLIPGNYSAGTLSQFDGRSDGVFQTEELDLGDWCAISGAAFSTGLGMRTSVGLSLLAGLANVRLGYWWHFDSDRPSPVTAAYRYLWAELMADFRGPWKPFWFLTDGGHFDNTGVYELVRRRVGIILLCDNSCDPDYRFDEVGNLARKIRTDFGAEMRPISPPTGLPGRYFATAEDFAKGERRRGKCALLYEIEYPHAAARLPAWDYSLLIVLKPNMIPGAPIDVAEYASVNEEFPHQTTLDQFFDDAQWESYRKLGELMADGVLDDSLLSLDRWHETPRPRQAGA